MSDNSTVDSEREHGDTLPGAKYWEIIASRLHALGWSYGLTTQRLDSGVLLHCVDAHRGDGKRLVIDSDELLTAFMELERQCRHEQ